MEITENVRKEQRLSHSGASPLYKTDVICKCLPYIVIIRLMDSLFDFLRQIMVF